MQDKYKQLHEVYKIYKLKPNSYAINFYIGNDVYLSTTPFHVGMFFSDRLRQDNIYSPLRLLKGYVMRYRL